MKQNRLPSGWDAHRVQRVLSYYEKLTEDEATTEDEAAFARQTQAVMEIPIELIPAVRELLAKYYGDQRVPA